MARALSALREGGDGHRLAEVALAALELRGLPSRERETLTAEAATSALESGDSSLEAAIRLAGTLWSSEHRQSAIARARDVLQTSDDPYLRARLRRALTVNAISDWDLDEAARLGSESHLALDAVGDHFEARNQLFFSVALSHLRRGDLGAFAKAAQQVVTYERAHHLNRLAPLALACVALWRGDLPGAVALSEGPEVFSPMSHLWTRAKLAAYRGEAASALEILTSRPVERVVLFSTLLFEGFRAATLHSLGRTDEAAALALHHAEGVTAVTTRPSDWGEAPVHAVEGALSLGELVELLPIEVVREAYVRLENVPQLRATVFPGGPGGSADWSRGSLALRLDLIDEAEQHFRTGLEWCERELCSVEAGRCHQGLAEVAERRGDHTLAMQHLDAAGELFARHGAKLYLDEVIAKKEILKA